MKDRKECWKLAIVAYRRVKGEPSLTSEQKDILDFLNSESWSLALELLDASDKTIQIGELSPETDFYSNFYLGKEGFFKTGQLEITHPKYFPHDKISSANIREIAEAFRRLHEEVSFTEFIYNELNKIAEACPK